MNPLKELFALGQAIGWIETQNTIALLRPVIGSTSRSAPGPTAGLAHLLRFRQVPLTAPEVFLGRLALCDVGHRSHELVAFERVRYSSRERVKVLDSPAGQQESVGMLEV